MPRAFLAIKPPPPVLDAVDARVAPVALPGARRTPRDQWHFTVQFLGDDADIAAVSSAFARDPLDVGAGTLRLGGADAIGRARRARILFLGLHEGGAWMGALAGRVAARLAPLGYAPDHDEAPFLPHLTIARFREPTDLRPVCAAIGPDPVGPDWEAGEVVLYESVLSPAGARHIERARVPVGT
jgi:2'-5' RNA ligase